MRKKHTASEQKKRTTHTHNGCCLEDFKRKATSWNWCKPIRWNSIAPVINLSGWGSTREFARARRLYFNCWRFMLPSSFFSLSLSSSFTQLKRYQIKQFVFFQQRTYFFYSLTRRKLGEHYFSFFIKSLSILIALIYMPRSVIYSILKNSQGKFVHQNLFPWNICSLQIARSHTIPKERGA